MKVNTIIIVLVCFLLITACKHEPSVWEISVQKVAHNGDTTGFLFNVMREYDSIATQKNLNVYDDSFMDGFQDYLQKRLSIASSEEVKQCKGETQRWEDFQYSWAWNYIGTSHNVLLRPDKKDRIYSIPVSWWKRSIAPSK